MCFITNPLAWYYFAFQDNILWTAKGKNGTNKSTSKIGVFFSFISFFERMKANILPRSSAGQVTISSIHVSEDNDIGSRSRTETLFLYSTLSFFSSSVSEMAIGTPCYMLQRLWRLTLSFSLIY